MLYVPTVRRATFTSYWFEVEVALELEGVGIPTGHLVVFNRDVILEKLVSEALFSDQKRFVAVFLIVRILVIDFERIVVVVPALR